MNHSALSAACCRLPQRGQAENPPFTISNQYQTAQAYPVYRKAAFRSPTDSVGYIYQDGGPNKELVNIVSSPVKPVATNRHSFLVSIVRVHCN